MLSEKRMKKILYDFLMEIDEPHYICDNETAKECEENGVDFHKDYCMSYSELDEIMEWLQK